MKKITCILALFSILFFSQSALAQTWSEAEKEVWTNVEKYWEVSSSGDIEGFISYFHDDFKGWMIDSPIPTGKASRAKYIRKFWPNMRTDFYNIEPLSVKVHGDIAIVHYLFHMLLVPTEQGVEMGLEMKEHKGRWTDILKKDGDRWVLIADAGGTMDDDDDDD